MRRLFLEWPIRLFNAWWLLYTGILTSLFMIVGTLTAIALLLAWAGIRWGW